MNDQAATMGIPSDWISHLEAAENDIFDLGFHDDIFWQLRAIGEANPAAHRDRGVWHWMESCYAAFAAMALRRLCDHRTDSHSLLGLLRAMAAATTSNVLTRQRFISMYPDSLQSDAQWQWMRLIGSDGTRVPKETLDLIGDTLLGETARVKAFANKRIAHNDQGPSPTADATWADLRNGIRFAFLCYRWVRMLLYGSHAGSVVPTYAGNWLRDLEVAWLPEGTPLPAYESLARQPGAASLQDLLYEEPG